MVSGFDIAAGAYDSSFTNTAIGSLQRAGVYRYLTPYLSKSKTLNILELNCGTGDDALFMGKMGHKVLATDLSSEMIARAKSKSGDYPNISFQQLDINKLDGLVAHQKLDLIFSNFGGLNCISPAQFLDFFRRVEKNLVTGGQIIAVIMSKKCFWERCYYLLKGASKKAFRRNTNGPIEVPVEGINVLTWYYNPKEIMAFAGSAFSKDLVKPIGFLIPPSYLNSFFRKKKKIAEFPSLVG